MAEAVLARKDAPISASASNKVSSSSIIDNRRYGMLAGQDLASNHPKLDEEVAQETYLDSEDAAEEDSSAAPIQGVQPESTLSMADRLHPDVSVKWAPCKRIPGRNYAHVKRIADIACSALALIALSPVLLVCSIAIKATSPGPIFFKQQRWGRS